MKFHPNHKHVAKILCKEPGRYAMHLLKLEGAKLIATDGRRLVILPVERDEEDTDGFVTKAALLAACSASTEEHWLAELTATTELHAPLAKHRDPDRPVDGEFPNYEGVVPKFSPSEKGLASISFDARYLHEIAKCIAQNDKNPCVTITFDPKRPTAPILVTGAPNGGTAVLMPVTIETGDAPKQEVGEDIAQEKAPEQAKASAEE